MISAMSPTYFSPHSSEHRPCWHCTSFMAMIYEGSAASCGLANAARVRSMPERGCSAWQREVGADDVPERVPACQRAHDGHEPSRLLPLSTV